MKTSNLWQASTQVVIIDVNGVFTPPSKLGQGVKFWKKDMLERVRKFRRGKGGCVMERGSIFKVWVR